MFVSSNSRAGNYLLTVVMTSVSPTYYKLHSFSFASLYCQYKRPILESCDLGNQEVNFIRDLFIANMQDPEIQRELLREALQPAQALRLAINMEFGQRNQLQFLNAQLASHVNIITPKRLFRQSNH